MRKIDLIVIHCSATRENTDYSPEQLESDHKARGFLRAGYNFYIRKSGEVVNLRPLEQIPAHARGHNKHSIDGTISPDEWIKQCPSFNAIPEYKELVYELRKK